MVRRAPVRFVVLLVASLMHIYRIVGPGQGHRRSQARPRGQGALDQSRRRRPVS